MANVLRSDKQQQVIVLGRLGWSLRRIEDETGVRRETVSKYLRQAGVEVRGPRGRTLASKAASQPTADSGTATPSNPASQPTTDSVPPRPSLERPPSPSWSPRTSACEPFRELIEAWVARGRTMKGVWQDLVDEHGFTASYECVKRFVRKIQPPDQPAPHPRIETEPGLESQVDYGDGPWVRDPATGKYRRSRIFAMTLGHSRKSVWLLTLRSSTQTWCRLHEKSFRRLGGTTRTVVLDNLKEGVIKPDVYDPELNPVYRDCLAHYGVVAIPARVRDPNRKGKVESAIGFAQKRLRGMRFESLAEAQAYLDRWSERWADTRIHGTTKRQVAAVFEESEKPALQPLPVEPFRYYEFGMRSVHLDGCVQVASAFYSAPPAWLGRKVHVQWCDHVVRILDPLTGELLREHTRQPPGHHRVHREDRGKRHPESVEYHLQRAEAAGPHVGALCRKLETRSGKYAVRHVLGVLSLAKSRGCSVVDGACQVALEAGAPTYRFVKRYLEHQEPPPPLKQVNELIRDLNHYRDLFERRTEQQDEQDRARPSPTKTPHVGHG